MITDTSYVIDAVNERPAAAKKSRELTERGEPQNLCTPVVYEVLTGIEYVQSRRERTRFNAIVDRFHVYDLDLKAARLAAEIDAELRRAGETRGPMDVEIAAIALTNDEPLLTNDRDFDVVEDLFGLRTEGY